MIRPITTIQEITLQAYAFGVYDYLFNERNYSRDCIFNLFEDWAYEFETAHEGYEWNGDYYDEIDAFVEKKHLALQLEDKFPGGISVGDHISYEGGTYRITAFSSRGFEVKEIVPRPGDDDWVLTEIGMSQVDKIKVIAYYEEIMDTTNSHDAGLVAKINEAWNEKREQFCPILRALYARDIKEIMDSDAWDWTDNVESVKETLHDEWDFHAHNYLMHIADDWDLKAILYFLRYEA